MTGICKRNKTYPINHLKDRGKVFDGDITYIKNDKKSQIDYVITNQKGRDEIVEFQVNKTNWHISSHRPRGVRSELQHKNKIGYHTNQMRRSQLRSYGR